MFTTKKGAVVLALGLVLALPAATAVAEPAHPVQLELGDSWTYGDGASDPVSTGYAGIVYEANKADFDCVPAQSEEAVDGCKHLTRFTLARPGTAQNPGVTTDLFIAEQLDPAVELLTSRNGDANPSNDVEVVLLTVGGNDVSGPVLQACLGGLTPECVGVIHERLGHVEANLGIILGELRKAAGPETVIVLATYDNAIAHCPIGSVPGATELGALVLEGYPPAGITGLNNVIRGAAASNDVSVADTYGQLGAGQWVGDCLHPSDAGYATIGTIVGEAING